MNSQCPGQPDSRPLLCSSGWCSLYTLSTAFAQMPPPSLYGSDPIQTYKPWRGLQFRQDFQRHSLIRHTSHWAESPCVKAVYVDDVKDHPSLAPSLCMPVQPVPAGSVSSVGNSSYWGPRASCCRQRNDAFIFK